MERVYEVEGANQAQLKAVLEADPYAQKSFARMGYKLKAGSAWKADAAKYYLYFNADEEFLKNGEEKLKDVPSFKRCEKAVEETVIAAIHDEEGGAEAGLGSIFG